MFENDYSVKYMKSQTALFDSIHSNIKSYQHR